MDYLDHLKITKIKIHVQIYKYKKLKTIKNIWIDKQS